MSIEFVVLQYKKKTRYIYLYVLNYANKLNETSLFCVKLKYSMLSKIKTWELVKQFI